MDVTEENAARCGHLARQIIEATLGVELSLDAQIDIADLVMRAEEAGEKPKRVRRTKVEMEAARAAEVTTEVAEAEAAEAEAGADYEALPAKSDGVDPTPPVSTVPASESDDDDVIGSVRDVEPPVVKSAITLGDINNAIGQKMGGFVAAGKMASSEDILTLIKKHTVPGMAPDARNIPVASYSAFLAQLKAL
jgi:hypothetical protein